MLDSRVLYRLLRLYINKKDGGMIINNEPGRLWEETVEAYFKLLSWNLPWKELPKITHCRKASSWTSAGILTRYAYCELDLLPRLGSSNRNTRYWLQCQDCKR
jgi:hypothetical protein